MGHAAVSGNREGHATCRKSAQDRKRPFQNRMNHAVSPVHIRLPHACRPNSKSGENRLPVDCAAFGAHFSRNAIGCQSTSTIASRRIQA
jgi:hypothetical protein